METLANIRNIAAVKYIIRLIGRYWYSYNEVTLDYSILLLDTCIHINLNENTMKYY